MDSSFFFELAMSSHIGELSRPDSSFALFKVFGA